MLFNFLPLVLGWKCARLFSIAFHSSFFIGLSAFKIQHRAFHLETTFLDVTQMHEICAHAHDKHSLLVSSHEETRPNTTMSLINQSVYTQSTTNHISLSRRSLSVECPPSRILWGGPWSKFTAYMTLAQLLILRLSSLLWFVVFLFLLVMCVRLFSSLSETIWHNRAEILRVFCMFCYYFNVLRI